VPDISIIIPTHNRAALIPRVVEALLRQSAAISHEIVIVDSASSDNTPRVLAELRQRHPAVKTLRTEKPGAAAARNAGLDAALGSLLILLDDDILVPADFLETATTAAAEHPGCALLGRIDTPWDGSTDPFLRFLLESGDVNSYDFKDPDNVPPQHFYTACVLLPRALLGQTRFDENFTVYGIEDLEFGIRLLGGGARMVYLPRWRVLHEYHPKYSDYRRKKFRTGYSLAYFFDKHPENMRHFYIEPSAERRWFRLHRLLAAPAAYAAYVLARRFNRTGRIPRMLYNWFYRDLRVRLFDGMRLYRRSRGKS
jgi:glycosyltransferase involved in cell wall biosynthesis